MRCAPSPNATPPAAEAEAAGVASPADQTPGRRGWYLLAPGIGIMLPVLLMGVIGIFSQQAIGNWNIAVIGAHISGWGFVAAIRAALAVLHTNAMNLYPSTVDLLVALNTGRSHGCSSRP